MRIRKPNAVSKSVDKSTNCVEVITNFKKPVRFGDFVLSLRSLESLGRVRWFVFDA